MDVWDKERHIDFVSCNPDTYIGWTIHQHSRKTSIADKTKCINRTKKFIDILTFLLVSWSSPARMNSSSIR
jgi:beta-xylosidase